MRCSVKGCGSNNKGKACKESYFSFPLSEPDLLEQWIKFCDQPGKKFNKAHVCEKHFKPEDFKNALQYEMGFTSRKFLKKGVVPSVKPCDVESVQQELIEQQKKNYKEIVEKLLQERDEELVALDENEIKFDECTLGFDDNLVKIKSTDAHFKRRQRTISNSTLCDELHQSRALQTELPDSKMIGFLSVTMDTTVYQINCFYCDKTFFLTDWPSYTEHMQLEHNEDLWEGHMATIASGRQEKVKQENIAATDYYYFDPLEDNIYENQREKKKPAEQKKKPTEQQKSSEQKDVIVIMDKPTKKKENIKKNKINKRSLKRTADKPSKVKRLEAKISVPKNPIDVIRAKIALKPVPPNCREIELLSLKYTDPNIIHTILDLMRNSFPLLWYIPPKNFLTYHWAVKELRQILIDQIKVNVTTVTALENFIQEILKWYMRVKEKNIGDKLSEPLIDYYNKCNEFAPDRIDGSKTCEICQESFIDLLQYVLHKKEVHNDENATTEWDLFSDAKKMKFYIDARWHYKLKQDRPFECQLCNTKWKLRPVKGKKERYFNHMKGHANLPEFVCDLCGKTYRRWNVFVIHRRRHTGIIKRVCLICGKMFNSYWDLTCHRVRYHRPIEGTIEEIESKYCSKRGPKGKSKYRTIFNAETKRFRLICPYCQKDYATHGSLYVHCTKEHAAEWKSDASRRIRRHTKKPKVVIKKEENQEIEEEVIVEEDELYEEYEAYEEDQEMQEMLEFQEDQEMTEEQQDMQEELEYEEFIEDQEVEDDDQEDHADQGDVEFLEEYLEL